MSGSTDRRTGSRADRSASASLPRLRWPSEQGRKSKSEPALGSAAPGEGEEEARQDPFVVEGLRQLALAVVIVLALGFFFIRIFGPNDASVVGAAGNDASRASPASLTNAPKPLWTKPPEAAARLEVDFDRPAPAGRPVPLRLDVADAPKDSTIVISGLGPNTTLSAGEDRDVEWRLGLADISNLSVIPPKDFVGNMILVVELRLPDGAVAGRQIVKLEWTGEAAAERPTEAVQPSPPPPPAASETPVAEKAAPEAPSLTESANEKQVARALPPQEESPAQAAAPAQGQAPAKQAAAARAEPRESGTGRSAPCFAKLDGKVVLQGNCRVAGVEGKSVTFESGEKRLSLTLDHGRIWRLKWNEEDKGKIYKREECWGSDKAFVCEHPPRPKPKS